ncbi:unnamed protein product [Urochloa humidicola]
MKKAASAAHTVSMVLFHLALLAGVLANLATLPYLPGYMAEGAKPPMDAAEVTGAAARLMAAGGALWWASVLIGHLEAAGKIITIFSVGAVGYAAYAAGAVVRIIGLWMGQGPTSYLLFVTAPCAFIIIFGALHVRMYYVYM